jgi:1-phosphofructokinase family hexose kinase
MIITITLNPAIDQTIEVERFAVGDTNRVVASRFDIGGKGINVARVLKELHYEPIAMGFGVGELGRMIEDQLLDSGIGCDFVYIPGETRTNLTILDRATHTHTVMSGPGEAVTDAEHEQFLQRVRRRLRRDSWMVIAGSIPPPGDPSVYVRLIRVAAEEGALVGLDADGPVVNAVLEAGARPALVKVNEHELARLVGHPVETERAAITGAEQIRAFGVPNVIVTRGGEPAVALTSEGDYRVYVPHVIVESAVGAGDAFLGGVLLGLKRGDGWEKALALGAAAGSACCLAHGTQLCRERDVWSLRPQAYIERLEPIPVGNGR